MDISPNFGIKKFKTKKEATDFLRRFTFKLILRWSEYDVWEIKEQPQDTRDDVSEQKWTLHSCTDRVTQCRLIKKSAKEIEQKMDE